MVKLWVWKYSSFHSIHSSFHPSTIYIFFFSECLSCTYCVGSLVIGFPSDHVLLHWHSSELPSDPFLKHFLVSQSTNIHLLLQVFGLTCNFWQLSWVFPTMPNWHMFKYVCSQIAGNCQSNKKKWLSEIMDCMMYLCGEVV